MLSVTMIKDSRENVTMMEGSRERFTTKKGNRENDSDTILKGRQRKCYNNKKLTEKVLMTKR